MCDNYSVLRNVSGKRDSSNETAGSRAPTADEAAVLIAIAGRGRFWHILRNQLQVHAPMQMGVDFSSNNQQLRRVGEEQRR